MKLHLPLSLRSALLVLLCVASSSAEDVLQDTSYSVSQNYFAQSGNYVGQGEQPTYNLTFSGDRLTAISDPNSMGFVMVDGNTLDISNIKTLTFKDFCLNSFSVDVDGDGGSEVTADMGAAICAGGASSVSAGSGIELRGSILLSNNGAIQFINNVTKRGGGGAIGLYGSDLNVNDNHSVLFDGNTASMERGGAIVAYNSGVYFRRNNAITFTNNRTDNWEGGAINIGGTTYSETTSMVFDANKSIEFSSNYARSGGALSLRMGSNSSETHVFQNNIGDASSSDTVDILFKLNESTF
ncbi:MAG: hypothetical protein IJB31_02685, partial [Akkermansia sp.]|nr:hypothetical protein [Akkermansia sp.]